MDDIYELITTNKDDVVKIIPNPAYGKGAYICDDSCGLDIQFATSPVPLENLECIIDPLKRFIKIKIKDVTNHIIYKGANSAISANYIKADKAVISDKYILQEIYIFLYVRNHIDQKTNTDDLEVQLVYKSESGVFINTIMHIDNKGSNSINSSLYETIFNSIVSSDKENKLNEGVYTKSLNELCDNKDVSCMTSIIPGNFIIDNRVDPLFYSWLDLNVGYKLYWIAFERKISISSTTFEQITKYMNKVRVSSGKQIPPTIYKTPEIGELIYYKIGNTTYNRRHYLYISLGGSEIPEYAQDKYGKRPDTDDGEVSGRGGSKKTDNLMIVNAPNDEKIIIEVDNKIKETFSNIKNKVLDIKEAFATINIKDVGPSNPPNINNSKNIIIYILSGIIILYVLYRILLYTNDKQLFNLSYITILMSNILMLPKKIYNNIFSSNEESHRTGGESIPVSTEPVSIEPVLPDTVSAEPVSTKQVGGGKYKLGLKKIKKRLI